MKYLTIVLIFCLVLFFYLHIFFHLKTSNDLEIYTIERPSKEKLEEICDLRQPVTFEFPNEELQNTCIIDNIKINYDNFDVKIRNAQDFEYTKLPLSFSEARGLLSTDSRAIYFSENNMEFLTETGLIKAFRYNDLFLRPHMVSSCIYDLIIGSKGCYTPLRYSLNYRNYFYVTEGSITIKLIPPSAGRYLYHEKDYDNFEFRSPMNPWNIQPEYKKEFGKIKALEIKLKKNEIVFIPAYWWYSILFDEMSTLCSFQYRTYMNTVAILPEIIIATLQAQNIKHQIAETLDLTQEIESEKVTEPKILKI